jgi:hypothetical protein
MDEIIKLNPFNNFYKDLKSKILKKLNKNIAYESKEQSIFLFNPEER